MPANRSINVNLGLPWGGKGVVDLLLIRKSSGMVVVVWLGGILYQMVGMAGFEPAAKGL